MAGGKRTTLKEVGETLAFIVERMTTKDDLKNFATKDDVREIVSLFRECNLEVNMVILTRRTEGGELGG